jgi:hypothetical protein
VTDGAGEGLGKTANALHEIKPIAQKDLPSLKQDKGRCRVVVEQGVDNQDESE